MSTTKKRLKLDTQDFHFFEIFRFSYMKNICSTILLIFWRVLVVIRKATGPDFDEIFEVPEIIQKVLQYDRGP